MPACRPDRTAAIGTTALRLPWCRQPRRRLCRATGAARHHALRSPLLPGVDDFRDGCSDRPGNVPAGVMRTHLAQVGVVTNVIAGAVLIAVGETLFLAGEPFSDRKG